MTTIVPGGTITGGPLRGAETILGGAGEMYKPMSGGELTCDPEIWIPRERGGSASGQGGLGGVSRQGIDESRSSFAIS
jgi:hypothetical protein